MASTTKKERKLEKEILGIFIFLGAIIVVFLVASWYFKSLNHFDYEGLSFSKERVGSIVVYHHSYYFKTPSRKLIHYNLYLRTDPRTSNVTITGGNVTFEHGKPTFVSVNSDGLQQCTYAPLALASFTSFLADNQITLVAGNLDFRDAGAKRDSWITCENRPGNKVVEILTSNETKISANGNCYRVEITNCEVLDALEKLTVQSLIDAPKAKI